MIRKSIIAFVVLTACAEFPALDDRISDAARAADYPSLVPIETLLAAADALPHPGNNASFDQRIAALQARAAALRVPVINGATRSRMRSGVALGPLR